MTAPQPDPTHPDEMGAPTFADALGEATGDVDLAALIAPPADRVDPS